MQVEISPEHATFVRHALSEALKRSPWLFDEEQREAINGFENRLSDATDEAYGMKLP